MLMFEQPMIEKWSPDFSSSGLSNPVWTRVKHENTVLCNSLEWTDWSTNPVQVEICDACGTTGCASGGYVHVSALGSLVLWTLPGEVPGIDRDLAGYPATAVEKFGSVGFAADVWDSMRAAAAEVPALGSLPRASGRVIRDAWAVGQTRPKVIERLVPMLRVCLLAADTLDVSEAIRCVENWLGWFQERSDEIIHGELVAPRNAGANIEKLYFDGPGTQDWVAFARIGQSFVPALSENLIFVPDEYSTDLMI